MSQALQSKTVITQNTGTSKTMVMSQDAVTNSLSNKASTASSTALSQLESWSCVSKIETAAGSITATCFEEKPTIDLPIQLKVVR